ncbi:MAG: hypothetical protein IH977_07555 [Nitrospinae bacterium]|nr:hypothetical protein [Nitrospinota bacterium]
MDSRLIIAGMADEEDGFPINNVGNDRLRKGGAADGACIGSEAKKGNLEDGFLLKTVGMTK